MSNSLDYKDIASSERTPLVEWLLNIIGEQQQIIEEVTVALWEYYHQLIFAAVIEKLPDP